MSIRMFLIYLGKLLVCGLVFGAGIILGSMVATMLNLPQPKMPAGINPNQAMVYLLLETPIMALALALIARGITGSFLTRTLTLFLLSWIVYTINTQLEAAIFTDFGSGVWCSVVSYAVATLLASASVAWLFPSGIRGDFAAAFKDFFGQIARRDQFWRLVVAALAFMPIYYLFGLMVAPFTSQYFQENMFGLQMPGLNKILMVMFIRSILFLFACLPVIVLWRLGRLELFLSLGFTLFVLVGLLYMLAAPWMPLSVRLPHALEMLADEFVYAGVLVMLLTSRRSAPEMIKSQAIS